MSRRMRPAAVARDAANDILAEDLRADAQLDRSDRLTPSRALPPLTPLSPLERLDQRVGEQDRLIKYAAEVVARTRRSLAADGKTARERTANLLRAKADLRIVEEALVRGRLGPAKERRALRAAGNGGRA